ncbi:unnamed protein product, partial [Durusdinium trenchii]
APRPSSALSTSSLPRGDSGYYSALDQVARSIPPVPAHCIDLCNRLGGTQEEVKARATRAWEAGHWAKAVLEGKINRPRPTPKVAQKPSCYIILRAPGITSPIRVDTAAEEAFSLALRKDQSPIPSLLWQKAESIAWLRDTRSLSSGGNDFDSFGGCEDFGPRYGYGPCGEDGLCRLGFPSWSEGGSGFSYYEEEGWTDVCSARGLLPHRGPRWWQFFGDGGPHAEVPLAIEVACLLIDFHVGIMEYLRGFDPVTEGDGIATFAQDNIDIFPESNSLLMAAYHWAEEGGDRVKFYSAAEEGGAAYACLSGSCRAQGESEGLGRADSCDLRGLLRRRLHAQELLALTMVTVEQAAQDGSKWEADGSLRDDGRISWEKLEEFSFRRRIQVDRAFHVIIVALNFWHADFTFVPLESLCREPTSAQLRIFRNLKRMLKAFGSCGEVFQVPACGRRIPTLMALLSDLWEGAGGDPYSRVFPGSKDGLAEIVPRDFGRAEELIPYRSLDPPFLSDPLWMAYMEPRSLLWTGDLRSSAVPDVSREDPKAVADLVPIWDAKGLLYLKDRPLAGGGSDLAMRFFNCYKSLEVDRMIGDRRACNYVEGRLTLVSPGLPAAHCLFDLEVSLPGNRLSICCADRKDFYHQFRVSEQRAVSNACYPLIDIKKTSAFQAWCLRNLKRKKYDRLLHGDRLIECILGSDDKDIWDAEKAKIIGAEPFMSLFDEVYKLVKSDEISQDSPKLHRLPCKAAQEVQLAAVLCPLFATDLSADFLPTLFATDASDAKGAVVAREISEGCSSALEDGQEEDQLCMLTRAEAVVRKLDWDSEEYQFGYKEPEEEQVSDPERPRAFRTKMRSLKEWQFFLEHELAHETWLASCMYGSVHKKEFLFLFANMETEFLHRKCSRDHAHVQIAGSYAKPSATYTDELAEALASAFDRALKTKLRSAALEPFELKGQGSEVAKVIAMDSNVGLSALVKGHPCRGGETKIPGAVHISPSKPGRLEGQSEEEELDLDRGSSTRQLAFLEKDLRQSRQEPPCHRLALPWQALLRDLILPSDVEFTISYGMLQIAEAKTRYRAARHQIAKIDQPQLLMVVSLAFEKLKPEFKLWPLSGQTMRSRFQRLLEACGLDRLPDNLSRGIDLGSLRAGGASWLLMVSEDSEMTRRRGRWISSKIMEIYVQEAWSIQFLHALPPSTKKTVLDGARAFPWLLEQAMKWHRALVPERIWFLLLRRLTEHELQLMGEDEFTLLAMTACVHHPS